MQCLHKKPFATDSITGFIKSKKEFCKNSSVFGFHGRELEIYVKWADFFEYLFVDSDEFGISGVGIAYPVEKKYDGTDDWFFSFLPPNKENEENCDICIMDFLSVNKESTNRIIDKFKKRYPNWDNQEKYALRNGVHRKITKKYIELLYNNGK
jgi:hypothetical protein